MRDGSQSQAHGGRAPRALSLAYAVLLPAVLALSAPASRTLSAEEVETPPAPAAKPLSDPLLPKQSSLLERRVFDVMNRHCARCHESRRLDALVPAAGIFDILDLDGLARRGDLIDPGVPENSPLYTSMISRHMPRDVFFEEADKPEPTADEINAVFRWIEGLGRGAVCDGNGEGDGAERGAVSGDAEDGPAAAPATPSQASTDPQRWKTLSAEISRLPEATARGRRYLDLAHLLTPCLGDKAADSERARLRAAAERLINLLSTQPAPVKLTAVEGAPDILSFELADAGWSNDAWERLANRDLRPNFMTLTPDAVRKTGSQRPVLDADWLANETLLANVYGALVSVPRTLQELTAETAGTEPAPEWPVDRSAVTGGRRLVRRIELTKDGAGTWIAADFDDAARTSDSSDPVQYRGIFPLPNGLPAFALFSRQGEARSTVHASVLPDGLADRADAQETGLGCLACHGAGPANSISDAASQDRLRYAGSSEKIAAERDPVLALAHRFRRRQTLPTVARRAGLSGEILTRGLQDMADAGDLRALRLLSASLPRVETDNVLQALRQRRAGLSTVRKGPPYRTADDVPFEVALAFDKKGYASGDPLIIEAHTSAPCNLSVISIGKDGEAVVLFPNDFETDNHLKPGVPVRIPKDESGFLLRVEHPGEERIVAICMGGGRRNPPGIRPEFELQRFTLLGAWEEHLEKALEADAKERRYAGKARRKLRRRERRSLPERADRQPLPQAWTARIIPELPDGH